MHGTGNVHMIHVAAPHCPKLVAPRYLANPQHLVQLHIARAPKLSRELAYFNQYKELIDNELEGLDIGLVCLNAGIAEVGPFRKMPLQTV